MPFANLETPSLALSLLKAALARVDIDSTIAYFTLPFAERIGIESYRDLTKENGERLGEWVFSGCLFEQTEKDERIYLEEVCAKSAGYSRSKIDELSRVRRHALPFLEECLKSVAWDRYEVIGFTTSFQQNTSSLALAYMIKTFHPDCKIVFGGANCEGVMGREILAVFPFVDFVCLGEGDTCFPTLVQQLLDDEETRPFPTGIVGRGSDPTSQQDELTDLPVNLEKLPYPEFDDYFQQLSDSAIGKSLEPRLELETSRGCWWGAKQHCTFCGLNGGTIAFRKKSPKRALDEILHFAEMYPAELGQPTRIHFTDNILDLHYFRELVPALQQSEIEFSFFYETKANLTKVQLRMLADAGIRKIQPGIESFSTSILKLMRKGCTSLQNVQILKWCHELGIGPYWNILYGFPGEDPAEYDDQCRVAKSCSHLTPPRNLTQISLHRFSPLFESASEFGVENVRPTWIYRFIYPFPDDVLMRLVYNFEFDYSDGRDPEAYLGNLAKAVERWQREDNPDFLHCTNFGTALVIWDGREARTDAITVLRGPEKALFEFCDTVRGFRAVCDFMADGCTAEMCRKLLDNLVSRRLVLEDENKFLSLAVPLQLDSAGCTKDEISVAELAQTGTFEHTSVAELQFKRSDGLYEAELGDETLVLDTVRRKLHHLNPMAGLILCLCDEIEDLDGLVAFIAARSNFDRRTVRRDAEDALRHFVAERLVEVCP